MGIISKQASKNSVSILLGTLLGAINTIIVLPHAFSEFPEGWGLLKVLIAYALIFAQFFGFGASNSFIRFSPRFEGNELRALHSFISSLPIVGMLVLGGIFLFTGESLISLINEGDAALLKDHLGALLFLTVCVTFFLSLSGYVSSILKTTFFQILNEPAIKGLYLILAILYFFQILDFDLLVSLYVGSYALILMTLLVFSFRHGFRISIPSRFPGKAEILNYGLYSILDKGANILVSNLDIIMIALLLDLDNVAFYTLAFYIGTVVQLPQKSINIIASPMAARAIEQDDRENLQSIYSKSSLNQLLIGGLIFACIWINVDDIFSLLPEKFQGGKWVVLFIGASKLISLISGVNGSIIVYSRYFRVNLVLNVILLIITIGTNLYFIPIYGMNGAALATLISLSIYNLCKLIFVWNKFKLHPIHKPLIIGCLLILGMSYAGYVIDFEVAGAFWTILIKGTFCAFVLGGLFLLLRLSPDINEKIRSLWK